MGSNAILCLSIESLKQYDIRFQTPANGCSALVYKTPSFTINSLFIKVPEINITSVSSSYCLVESRPLYNKLLVLEAWCSKLPKHSANWHDALDYKFDTMESLYQNCCLSYPFLQVKLGPINTVVSSNVTGIFHIQGLEFEKDSWRLAIELISSYT